MSENTTPNFVALTVGTYWKCCKNASHTLIHHWPIIVASPILVIAYNILAATFAPLGIAGGFVVGLLQLFALSLFYSWIRNSFQSTKTRFKDLFLFDSALFFDLLSVLFIFFIVKYLVSNLIFGLNQNWILHILLLGIVIIFNSIPEVIYSKRLQSLGALTESFDFIKENWIEWFIPFIVLLLPMGVFQIQPFLYLTTSIDPMLPGISIVSLWRFLDYLPTLLLIPIQIAIGVWITLFRGFLFNELDGSTRRSRAFSARM